MLTLVPTPIGNADDITLRALAVLREADLIACEDTRRTRVLLQRHDVRDKKLVTFFEHNESAAVERLLDELRAQKRVALVSNGGTPAVSDPGFRLVRAAVEEDLPVEALPGPVACITALVVSGLPVASFTFLGFPPRKEGKLRGLLERESVSPHTLILYESPHRIGKFLAVAADVLGDRPAAVCRELTKKFEEVRRGTLEELAARYAEQRARGELVVVIAGH